MKVIPRVISCFIRLSIVFICFLTPASANAECAVPGPICESFMQAIIVFHGEVVEVAAPKTKYGLVKVQFRQLEGFKGVASSNLTTLTFRFSYVDFQFVQGQRLLVY